MDTPEPLGSKGAEISAYDASEYLDSEEMIISYITSVAEECDWPLLSRAIGHAAKSIAMSKLAARLGMDRSLLYNERSQKSIPVQEIIKALLPNFSGPNQNLTEYVDGSEMADIEGDSSLNRSLRRGHIDALTGQGRFLYSPDDAYHFDEEELDALVVCHLNIAMKECQSLPSASENSLDFSEILVNAIRDISEKEYCAGWREEIEFEIWDRIHSNHPDAESLSISPAQCVHFKILSRLSQGWIHFGDQGQRWIPLQEWRTLFATWKSKRAC